MSSPSPRAGDGRWRGWALVVLGAIFAFLTASSFDLAERWQRLAGRFETLEADEIPWMLLTLAVGFGWLGWRELRRSRRALVESQRREAALEQQKAESLAVFASGTAHDFSYLLFAVDSFAARGDSADPAVRGASLDGIRAAASQGRAVIAKLKDLADPKPATLEAVDLNTLLAEHEALLGSLLPDPDALRCAPGHAVARAWANPTSVTQILLNLVANARDASRPGDVIVVSTANAPGGRVRLRVRDFGVGIDAEQQARLFDPFFTTKPAGQGSGLGLALSRVLAGQLGASIEVESEPGAGASFDVVFRAATT